MKYFTKHSYIVVTIESDKKLESVEEIVDNILANFNDEGFIMTMEVNGDKIIVTSEGIEVIDWKGTGYTEPFDSEPDEEELTQLVTYAFEYLQQ